MSTFLGQIEEIPGICIDYFVGDDNLKSSLFFLSHCHTDHMKGLKMMLLSPEFKRRNVFLYGSPTTVLILRKMYPEAVDRLRELEIGPRHFLRNDLTRDDVGVTLIPAGHCLGSVMFLFETDKTILYTGDIRLTVEEVKLAKCFKNMSGNVKKIDKMYFDSTFFRTSCDKFPRRTESIEAFINAVKYALQTNKHIFYQMSAKYGTEFLIIEASKALKLPFHVSEQVYDIYKFIPEMDNCVTLDPTKTKLHASLHFSNQKHCCDHLQKIICKNPGSVYHLKTSAQRWEYDDFSNGITETKDGKDFVFYSSHCSYQELIDIFKYLKPNELYPCVVPDQQVEKEQMMSLIKKTLEDIHKNEDSVSTIENVEPVSWTFGEGNGNPTKRIKIS